MAINLAAMPVFDAHLHPPRRVEFEGNDAYLRHWYEGPPTATNRARHLVAVQSSLPIVADFLSCDPTIEAVAAEIQNQPVSSRWQRAIEAGRITGLVIDTGFPPPSSARSIAELGTPSHIPAVTLLRIEAIAGEIARVEQTFDSFIDRFDAALNQARSSGHAGLKSVIAYRSGLAVGAADVNAARSAFASEPGRQTGRLTTKPLLDFLFVRAVIVARRDELPFQIHCGYGDADIDLLSGNPLLLKPLLDSEFARGVTFVLLHGAFPYTSEAAWLSAVYPNVIVDVCTCIPPVAASGVVDMWRKVLAVAPTVQVQASSDATGLPEQILVGATLARQTLAQSLGELHGPGGLSASQCEDIASHILHANARRIYLGHDGW